MFKLKSRTCKASAMPLELYPKIDQLFVLALEFANNKPNFLFRPFELFLI